MDLQYHLISNKTFLRPASLELRNEIYVIWKQYWEKIYAEQGSDHTPETEDFIRHDLFSALTVNGGKIVGFSAHTLLDFNEKSTYDRDFFSMFGRSYSAALQKQGVDRVMTFESLIVLPEYRHNQWSLPLSRLIMRLNSYVLSVSSAEAVMAVARIDNGVSRNLGIVGYDLVEADKNCRGFPCDLKFLKKEICIRPLQDKTEPLAGTLWNDRQVHFGDEFVRSGQTEKRAA